MSEDFDLHQLSADLALDVADAAADHGCPEQARGLYRLGSRLIQSHQFTTMASAIAAA
jgi:hypothetical protein